MFGGCLQWLFWVMFSMAYEWYSGKDNRWNLTIPPWCVFVCVSVSFLHFFFVKSALDRAHTVLYLAQVTSRSTYEGGSHPPSPWCHLYLTFLCPLLCVQRSRTASPQCQRYKKNLKSPGSSPESHRSIKQNWHTTNSRQKGMPNFRQSFSWLSCTNFLL